MLFAIGAGSQVKAVDSYSDYPPGAPVTKLDANSPNVEAIASYRPDLVVVSTDTSGFNEQMVNLHIPVIYDPPAADLAEAYQQYLGLGEATGELASATREVASVKGQVAHIVSEIPKAPSGTTYYYELDPTYYSVTTSTFVGQLLGLLGLTSIADSAKGAAASGCRLPVLRDHPVASIMGPPRAHLCRPT
jgi:iron complex transport system substrate-binding protein